MFLYFSFLAETIKYKMIASYKPNSSKEVLDNEWLASTRSYFPLPCSCSGLDSLSRCVVVHLTLKNWPEPADLITAAGFCGKGRPTILFVVTFYERDTKMCLSNKKES